MLLERQSRHQGFQLQPEEVSQHMVGMRMQTAGHSVKEE